MISITLTTSEMRMACSVGIERQLSSLANKRKDQHGFTGNGFTVHVMGALAEAAVAKALNVFYTGSIDTFKQPDVEWFQVRWTETESLIIRPADDPTEKFVCVTGTGPDFVIRGWMTGVTAAANPSWRRAPGGRPPAYFVPFEYLRELENVVNR